LDSIPEREHTSMIWLFQFQGKFNMIHCTCISNENIMVYCNSIVSNKETVQPYHFILNNIIQSLIPIKSQKYMYMYKLITQRFAVIGYTGSKRSRAICCFLTRNEIITEIQKKVNILITFQFYQLLFLLPLTPLISLMCNVWIQPTR
jgi:hypothetical protein